MDQKQEILEKIYSRTLNARDTYKKASKNVHNRLLTDFFEKAAEKHEIFADFLTQEMNKQGMEVKESLSSSSKPDQFWLDFASIIVLRNEPAMLKKCLKAENKAIELYDVALQDNKQANSFHKKLKAQRDYAVSLSNEIDMLEKQYASD